MVWGYHHIFTNVEGPPTHLSWDERQRLRHISKNYLIVDNTLYHLGVDSILRCCLTHEEAKVVLNDSHGGVCGGHLSGLSTAQKNIESGLFLAVHIQRLR